MAILKMMAVYDQAVNGFMPPFGVPHVGLATRSFTDQVNRAEADNSMYRHPNDYVLYVVGEYDDQFGRLIPMEHPEVIVRGADVKERADA